MKIAWILFCMSCCASVFAQQLKITPAKPSVTDSISIEYDPIYFGDASPIECRVYFSGISSDERDFPKVSVISLTKNGKYLKGQIYPVPANATAMVITFTDSLGNRDTNNRNGYWKLLYQQEKPLKGSWAGVGDLLYGGWITENCVFHLGQNLDSTQAFFKRDLMFHPDIKNIYMRQYLASFKTGTPETNQELKNELDYLSASTSLSELDLQSLRHAYARINDTLNANRCEREIFTRFPNGSWTPQVKSLPLLAKAGSSRNFNDQAKAYQEFKKTFLKQYDTEFGNFAMNYRAARILVYMVNHFSTEGTMDLWKKEVSMLSDRGKFAAYQQGSQNLLENSSKKIESSQTQIENKLYQFNLNPDQKLKDAEDLALLAIEIWNESSNNIFRQNESYSMTADEIAQMRNGRLSDVKALLGSSLLKQNKIEEAVVVLKEAIEGNRYSNPETNEVYIEALVKSGKIDLALSETQKIIGLGKSTPTLDAFYTKTAKEKSILSLLQEKNLDKVKSLMTQKLVHEKGADFTVQDLSGKSISSKSLKNKIVVITFWASWCAPCIVELKSVDAVVKKFKNDTDVIFLSVNEDDIRERAMEIVKEYETKNHFVFDEKRKMLYGFGANGLPTQVILDKKGEIRFRNGGLSSFNERENTVALEAMISVLKDLD